MSAPVGFVNPPQASATRATCCRSTRRLVVPSLRRVDAPKADNLRADSARTRLRLWT